MFDFVYEENRGLEKVDYRPVEKKFKNLSMAEKPSIQRTEENTQKSPSEIVRG